jgi:NAD(P)-dependent dehydrogenase (short-subunit alcohol dehydrogenase family)
MKGSTFYQPQINRRGSVLVVGVGAHEGLGAAIARRFALEGNTVVIAGRNKEKIEITESILSAEGLSIASVVGDAEDVDDMVRFVQTAQNKAPLVAAIHNAGTNHPAPFLEIGQTSFEKHWREHTLGGFLLAQTALPLLLSHGGGSLLFTGASGALRGRAHYAAFAVAKAGLRMLAQSLAREYGPHGIHVGHIIIDGGIHGERLLSRLSQTGHQPKKELDGLLDIEAVADVYWMLHQQHRSAWTLELDLRPWVEPF